MSASNRSNPLMSFPHKRESTRRNPAIHARERYAVTIWQVIALAWIPACAGMTGESGHSSISAVASAACDRTD
jgi:hypothetical protein